VSNFVSNNGSQTAVTGLHKNIKKLVRSGAGKSHLVGQVFVSGDGGQVLDRLAEHLPDYFSLGEDGEALVQPVVNVIKLSF
jgi:hypothetical protein